MECLLLQQCLLLQPVTWVALEQPQLAPENSISAPALLLIIPFSSKERKLTARSSIMVPAEALFSRLFLKRIASWSPPDKAEKEGEEHGERTRIGQLRRQKKKQTTVKRD